MSEQRSPENRLRSSNIDSDFLKIQMEQAFETYRTQFSLLTQAGAVLVIANITIIGYVMSEKLAGLLLVGAAIPIMVWIVINSAARMMLPIVYSAINLEQTYGGGDFDWLASTFVSYKVSREYFEELQAVSANPDPVSRIKQLHRVKAIGLISRSGHIRTLLILATISQIITPIVLVGGLDWKFL